MNENRLTQMQMDLATAQAESKLNAQNLSQEKLNALAAQNFVKLKQQELGTLQTEVAQLRVNS